MKAPYYSIKIKCPHCHRGEVLANHKAEIETSIICDHCNRAYVVNWQTLKARKAEKQKRE